MYLHTAQALTQARVESAKQVLSFSSLSTAISSKSCEERNVTLKFEACQFSESKSYKFTPVSTLFFKIHMELNLNG